MRVFATRLEEYRRNAREYIEHLANRGWNTPPASSKYLIDNLLHMFRVTVKTGANLKHRDAIMIPEKNRAGDTIWVLMIDKKFQRDPKANVYWKKHILHELGHLVRDHNTCRISGWKERDFASSLEDAKVASREELENEAEIMGGVILFWPESVFLEKIFEFKYDLIEISDFFEAEIDCCAKYILLNDSNFHGHYLKYNVTLRVFDDYFIPTDYDAAFEKTITDKSWSTSSNTALGTCIIQNAINLTDFRATKTSKFLDTFETQCNAFYRPKSTTTNIEEDDKVICIGFKVPKKQC